MRAQISRHITKVNLGFFDQTTSGALKKVIIEDVERIEVLAPDPRHRRRRLHARHHVHYLLTLNVPMALGMLVPVLGVAVQLFAMAAGKQMRTTGCSPSSMRPSCSSSTACP
ncbi:MAG: hypothetical protein ACLTMP_00510 [Eggerthella lenta]